jgi:hypothetical protein
MNAKLEKIFLKIVIFVTLLAFAALTIAVLLHDHHPGGCGNGDLCIFCTFIQHAEPETSVGISLSRSGILYIIHLETPQFNLYSEHLLPYLNGPPRFS